jgi:hypothetical protein
LAFFSVCWRSLSSFCFFLMQLDAYYLYTLNNSTLNIIYH